MVKAMAKKPARKRPVTGLAAVSRVLGGIIAYDESENRKDRGNPAAKHKRALNRIRDGRQGRVRFKVI